jgi:hypothetical protein
LHIFFLVLVSVAACFLAVPVLEQRGTCRIEQLACQKWCWLRSVEANVSHFLKNCPAFFSGPRARSVLMKQSESLQPGKKRLQIYAIFAMFAGKIAWFLGGF